MIENSINTIKKIKDLFHSIGCESNDLISELNKLQSKKSFLERHIDFILTENSQAVSKNKTEKSSYWLRVKDNTKTLLILEFFGDGMEKSNTDSAVVLKKEKLEFFFKNFEIFENYFSKSEITNACDWNIEEVKLGLNYNIWDWKELSKSSKIDWNFTFLEEFKEFLDWRFVKANKKLHWVEHNIEYFAPYIFSAENFPDNEWISGREVILDKWRKDFEYADIEWNESLIEKYSDKWNWDKISSNQKIFLSEKIIEKFSHKLNFKAISERYVINEGYLTNAELTPKLLKKFKDSWDFTKLVQSSFLQLDFSVIELLKDKLDWTYLISNDKVFWTEYYIEKYEKYIFSVNENISNYDINRDLYLKKTKHTGHFESNINVAWSEDIITKYKEKWQWNYLIKNPQIKFNIEQLNNYKEFIPWNIFFGHGNCNWDENIIEKYKIYDQNYYYGLVKNPHIIWNQFLFEKYIKPQNSYILSEFCRFAKISSEFIIKNKELWKTPVEREHKFDKSDFGLYRDYTNESLWYDLSMNKNIVWDDNLLEECIDEIVINEISTFGNVNISVEFINKYWNFSKLETIWHIGNYDEGCTKSIEMTSFRRLFKYSTIINLSIEDIINHEIEWTGTDYFDLISIGKNNVTYNKSIEKTILEEINNFKEKNNI